MSPEKERIAELYFISSSFRLGQFRLSIHQDNPNLPLSPYYMHYPLPGEPGSELLPELFDLCGAEFYNICESQDPPIRPTRIAAVPNGADPLGRAHARHYDNYPRNLLRLTKKEVGGKTEFVGPYGVCEPGDDVTIDDDHTSGGRHKRLVKAAVNAGGLVTDTMLTVVDRQQGGVENMARVGVRLLSIFTIDQLLDFGLLAGFASEDQVSTVRSYQASNPITL